MNQTQKRLNIIKLAISIGDSETIQLQLLKLAPLKTDEKIQEIIQGLQAKNYAQTQALITEYIETPTDEILQRISQEESDPQEDEETIEAFDLFRVTPDEEAKTNNELYTLESDTSHAKPKEETNHFNALLSLTSDDILTDRSDIPSKQLPQDEENFFTLSQENTTYDSTELVKEDLFFNHETCKEESLQEEERLTFSDETKEKTDTAQTTEKKSLKTIKISTKTKEEVPMVYDAIPYIDQKLKTMQTQYPPVEEPEGTYPSVDAWLIKISNEGYTEKEVEETITYLQKLAEKKELAEAAQLLLVTAATQSKYAQFMLARALFKGEILKKNLPESFTLINRLAMDDDYPEAICDLGQLYEYGIGIDKDKRRAEELYKEAMELGIKRAVVHYERIHREKKGLLGKIFGRK